MKKSISKKITRIVILIVFFSIALLGSINFYASYKQTLKAAGIELTGCANITTGIINAEELFKLTKDDSSVTPSVNEQLNWTVDHKPIFSTHYILSLDGKVLASDQHLKDIGLEIGSQVALPKEALTHLMQGHTYYTSLYVVNGEERQTGYAPLFKDHNPKNEVIAINAIDFDGQVIRERTWETNKGTLVVTVLLPIIAAFITFVLVKKMIQPIRFIQKQVENVANGDLTHPPLKIETNDELQALAQGVNTMVQSLKTLINEINQTGTTTTNNAQELSASAEVAHQAIQTMNTNINQTSDLILNQTNLTQQADQHLNQISTHLNQMDKTIQHSNEMAIHSYEHAQSGQKIVDQTLKQMQAIHENTGQVNDIIHSLNYKSREISQVISIITRISSQTNLLALNASIEAARAQEHGRGFLVVAEEIRELSVQTKEATQQVSTLINEIQLESKKSVEQATNSQKLVDEGITFINETNQAFNQIANTAQNTANQSKQLTNETKEIKAKMRILVEEVHHVSQLAHQVNETSQQTGQVSAEQIRVMDEFVLVSRNLSIIADQLKQSIQQFQIK
ncbi:MAG: methyl-accepting chemotaxis protein [Enterococcus sp.]|nr:methyl-accepting chemotaxis protein [Enterococcus sp.]